MNTYSRPTVTDLGGVAELTAQTNPNGSFTKIGSKSDGLSTILGLSGNEKCFVTPEGGEPQEVPCP